MAQVAPRQDSADIVTSAWPSWRSVSKAREREGKAEGNDGSSAEALLLYLLDVEGRARL